MTTLPNVERGMPYESLALLHCPYCGGKLRTESTDPEAEGVLYGIARCACYEYPIVAGIPILQQLAGLSDVVQLIRASDQNLALLRTFDLFRVQWSHRSRLHRLKYRWNCKQLITRSDITFSAAITLIRQPKVFSDYLIHRFANPSFLAAIGPILMLAREASDANAGSPAKADRGVRVLDLACGTGHASYLLRLLRPSMSLVSADQDFINVYLARRYLVPDGFHLCLDAQVPSPFPDRHFDAVYCQDAFHYIQSKEATVRELKRVTRPDALWVFPHLHNSLCPNLVPGTPMPPDDYLRCFDLSGARLFSESKLLTRLRTDRVLDLSAMESNLNDAPNLTLISGNDATWRIHEGFPKAFCDRSSNFATNPIYRSRSAEDGLHLERHWPNPVMQRECAEAETVLPKTYHIDTQQLSLLNEGAFCAKTGRLDDLVAKFVLVPLPQDYSPGCNVWARHSTSNITGSS